MSKQSKFFRQGLYYFKQTPTQLKEDKGFIRIRVSSKHLNYDIFNNTRLPENAVSCTRKEWKAVVHEVKELIGKL